MTSGGFDTHDLAGIDPQPTCKTCLDDGWIEVDDGPGYRTVPCPEGCLAPEEVPF